MSPLPTALARRQREIAAREVVLLDAAQAQIQRDGLLSLQMARVADECGYAIGTLYKHFASKEDLLVALDLRLRGVEQRALARSDLALAACDGRRQRRHGNLNGSEAARIMNFIHSVSKVRFHRLRTACNAASRPQSHQ